METEFSHVASDLINHAIINHVNINFGLEELPVNTLTHWENDRPPFHRERTWRSCI